MKLIEIRLPENTPRELRLVRAIDLLKPIDAVIGWRVLVRGPAVILLSPKGPGHEFARSACILTWDSSNVADYDKLQTYTSDPLSRTPAAEISDEALERATAPKAAGK